MHGDPLTAPPVPGDVALAAAGGAGGAGGAGEAGQTPPDLRRFVGYQITGSVGFSNAIWVVFLHERGLSLGEIGLAEAAFHLAPLTLELPTGAFADLFGRRWSLVASSLLSAAGALVTLAVHDVWLAIPALYLTGAAMTFASGAQQAFLYDALAAGGDEHRFGGVFGRLLSVSFLVTGLTALLGATLADISFAWPYGLSAGVAIVGAILAAGLREPTRVPTTRRGLGRHICDTLRVVHGQPRLAALLGFGAVFWTAVTLIELYAQAVLDAMGVPTPAIGLLIGGGFVLVAAGAWLTERLTVRGSLVGWTVGLTAVVAAGALGLGSEVLPLAVATFVIFEAATGVYEPFLADHVNRGLAPGQRATILSLQGFLFSLTMVWAFPLLGWTAGRAGWMVGYGLVAAVLVGALVAWLAVERRYPALDLVDGTVGPIP